MCSVCNVLFAWHGYSLRPALNRFWHFPCLLSMKRSRAEVSRDALLAKANSMVIAGGSQTVVKLADTLKTQDAQNVSRINLRRTRAKLCDPLLTSIDVEMESGEEFAWTVTDVGPTLQTWLHDRPDAKECFEAAIARFPRSAWKAVVGFDEFDPSPNLMGAHRKKLMNVHFTFLELGPHALVSEDFWVTLASTTTCLFAAYGSFMKSLRKLGAKSHAKKTLTITRAC